MTQEELREKIDQAFMDSGAEGYYQTDDVLQIIKKRDQEIIAKLEEAIKPNPQQESVSAHGVITLLKQYMVVVA